MPLGLQDQYGSHSPLTNALTAEYGGGTVVDQLAVQAVGHDTSITVNNPGLFAVGDGIMVRDEQGPVHKVTNITGAVLTIAPPLWDVSDATPTISAWVYPDGTSTLGAGAYFVEAAYRNFVGDIICVSNEIALTVLSGESIAMRVPNPLPYGATDWVPYITQPGGLSGSETSQLPPLTALRYNQTDAPASTGTPPLIIYPTSIYPVGYGVGLEGKESQVLSVSLDVLRPVLSLNDTAGAPGKNVSYRTILQTDTVATLATILSNYVAGISGLSEGAESSAAVRLEPFPSPGAKGTDAGFPDATDKAHFELATKAPSFQTVRLDVPAPKSTIFNSDGFGVDLTNALVTVLTTLLTDGNWITSAGIVLGSVLKAYRTVRKHTVKPPRLP